MDPISASTYNLSTQQDTSHYQSTKSLSYYEHRSFKTLLPQILATCASTFNNIVVGIALAYSGILIAQLESKDSDIRVSKSETSWIASVMVIIAPVGIMGGGYIMDKIGRLNTVKISIVPGFIGWILIATASNVSMIIIGRIFIGLFSNLCTSPAIVYITEIARKDMRGSLIAVGPTFVSLGMVIAYLKGWFLHWRTTAWLCNLYIILPFFILFILPESPVWLVSRGRVEEAKKALEWLHKYQPQKENEKSFAELQLAQLLKENEMKKFEEAKNGGNTIKEFFKATGYKPLLIISGLFFFQQFSGIYVIIFYSVTFFEDVGTTMNPYFASIWIGLIRLVMSLANTWMLKYFTRRKLIIISALGMAVCTLISGFFTYWIKIGTTDQTWVPVVFLLFYVVASMIGLLTIPWTMTAELFPLKIRSLAHSICNTIANVFLFVAVQSYVTMEVVFGGSAGVQWFFSIISLLTIVFVVIFLPETHGKKLSEIEEYFNHNTIYLCQRNDTKIGHKQEADSLLSI